MKFLLPGVIFLLLALPGRGEDFAKGADVSWLPQMEASGYRFLDRSGRPEDCLRILKAYGIDTVRLRVWVHPSQDRRSGHCSRDEVAAMAQRAAAMGFRIMIDFHYSDSWCDPGKQATPAAWAGDSLPKLEADVRAHTVDVLTALKARGVTPEWVQVGNEIAGGMLWPTGSTRKDYTNLAALINAGYDAVKSVDPATQVVVHIHRGNDNALYRTFFDGIQAHGARYDVIGMSYYPHWQHVDYSETIDALGANLVDMAERYHKGVMVVELGGEASRAENTRAMISAVIDKVRAVPDHRGLGVIYWEPEGAQSWSGYALSCWGADRRPTDALEAFLEKPVSMPFSVNTFAH
ncbi:MAG TPA: glycosyl hydrolase 53 family protein [Chthoniobacteraceae bacterium]|jgi:arabinogalactan endo-1,4-beta-galactosidase|nr:glycosyl hydrolase 53 family protein [Chthoniobacteraceae bacterium]